MKTNLREYSIRVLLHFNSVFQNYILPQTRRNKVSLFACLFRQYLPCYFYLVQKRNAVPLKKLVLGFGVDDKINRYLPIDHLDTVSHHKPFLYLLFYTLFLFLRNMRSGFSQAGEGLASEHRAGEILKCIPCNPAAGGHLNRPRRTLANLGVKDMLL